VRVSVVCGEVWHADNCRRRWIPLVRVSAECQDVPPPDFGAARWARLTRPNDVAVLMIASLPSVDRRAT
jgi:hypothetical protein